MWPCQRPDSNPVSATDYEHWPRTRHSIPACSLFFFKMDDNNSMTAKNLPAMQETWVLSLSREDPLEEGMATHSSILAWRIPWIEEPGRLQSIGSQKADTTERLTHTMIP